MTRLFAMLSFCILALSPLAFSGGDDVGIGKQPAPAAESDEALIAWFGRLDDAKAEADRTNRPILLMSAAPQCSGAPGMW